MFGLNSKRIFGLAVLALVAFAGFQYIPPYINAFQFNDFVRQEVKFAGPSRRTTEDVRNSIVAKAQEVNLPVGPRDIKITRRGPTFTLDLQYRVPIDMRVYQHDLVFEVNESGEAFER
jgi:hypothetical protein